MTFILITLFLLIPYAGLILYYRKSWISIEDFIPAERMHEIDLPFVSIIIAARNEEKNIGKCIKSLITQTYPRNKFEIIITDDHSTDQTVPIIKAFSQENITVLSLADFTGNNKINSYKKKSIETALKFAKGDLIVTTSFQDFSIARFYDVAGNYRRFSL